MSVARCDVKAKARVTNASEALNAFSGGYVLAEPSGVGDGLMTLFTRSGSNRSSDRLRIWRTTVTRAMERCPAMRWADAPGAKGG